MGRWSRRLAPRFLEFAGVVDGDRVLDVGSGTGALTETVLAAAPRSPVIGIEVSAPYVESAGARLTDPRARFDLGDARSLPYPDASFDACLSLLVVQFIPDAPRAVGEMRRVTRPGGRVAACVWDGSGGMEMLRAFWDAAVALDPSAEPLSSRHRPYSRRGELARLWAECGLADIEETDLVIPLEFASFEDFWAPHLEGQGPAAAYATQIGRAHV